MKTPKGTNPSLAFTIWNVMRSQETEGTEYGLAIVHAAVWGWYEGHVEAHAAKGRPSPVVKAPDGDDFPAPPAPDRDSVELKAIIDETSGRFAPSVAAGAFAFAAGLGWAAGFKEGSACGGCVTPGDPSATAIRAGLVPVTLSPEFGDMLFPRTPGRRAKARK
jgi:hypothetical protein